MALKLAELEQALINRVSSDAAIKEYAPRPEHFQSLSIRNLRVDSIGRQSLVAPKLPAFLFVLEASSLTAADTITRQTYDYQVSFRIYAFHNNPRGPVETKLGSGIGNEVGVYRMLDDLKAALAGARLDVAGVSSKPQVELLTEALVDMSPEGTIMSLAVRVHAGWP